jgi:hypothetical protein
MRAEEWMGALVAKRRRPRYIRAMSWPYAPQFPLDPEIVNAPFGSDIPAG